MYCTEKHRGLLLFKSSKHSRQIEINGYFLNNFLMYFPAHITKYTQASRGFQILQGFRKGLFSWKKLYSEVCRSRILECAALKDRNIYWTRLTLLLSLQKSLDTHDFWDFLGRLLLYMVYMEQTLQCWHKYWQRLEFFFPLSS